MTRTHTRVGAASPLPFVISPGSETAAGPVRYESHSHSAHELVWVRRGSLTAEIGRSIVTVFAGVALWLPAGTVHAGTISAGAEFHNAYFAPSTTPITFHGPSTISMTDLLGSLLTYLAEPALDSNARSRAESVAFDLLIPAEHQYAVAVPDDPRIAPIATALLADPADAATLDEWARRLDISDRTITRVFFRTTGLTFVQWKQTIRVHRAIMLISDGVDVRTTSELVGYAQASTFIEVFRRVTGTTPGALIGQYRSRP